MKCFVGIQPKGCNKPFTYLRLWYQKAVLHQNKAMHTSLERDMYKSHNFSSIPVSVTSVYLAVICDVTNYLAYNTHTPHSGAATVTWHFAYRRSSATVRSVLYTIKNTRDQIPMLLTTFVHNFLVLDVENDICLKIASNYGNWHDTLGGTHTHTHTHRY